MAEVKITKKGKNAHLDGLEPELILIVEVCKRLDRVTEDNLADLCEQLTHKYGSAENAVIAFKPGAVCSRRGGP